MKGRRPRFGHARCVAALLQPAVPREAHLRSARSADFAQPLMKKSPSMHFSLEAPKFGGSKVSILVNTGSRVAEVQRPATVCRPCVTA